MNSFWNTNRPFRLTYWVFDTVAAELSDRLCGNPAVHVSINVPPEILGRGGLSYAAEKSGLRAFFRQVVLEITERGVLDLLGLQALNEKSDFVIRWALDDLSMSGANLALLTRCPFTVTKVDRALVKQIGPETPHPQWLRGIASLLQTTRLGCWCLATSGTHPRPASQPTGSRLRGMGSIGEEMEPVRWADR